MKKYFVTVNGNRYEVEIEETEGVSTPAATPAAIVSAPAAPVSAPVSAPAPAPEPKKVVSAEGGEKIECPMPGTILKVEVKEGASFKRGDVLFVLEAMKMENEIRAPRDGQVIQIATQKGASVNTNDLLAVIK